MRADDSAVCWEAPGTPDPRGRRRVWRNRKWQLAHVAAWEERAEQDVPPGMCVCHTCDNPACRRNDGPEGTYEVGGASYRRFGHLWLGTQAANMADMKAKGRAKAGPGPKPEQRPRGDQHYTRLNPELGRAAARTMRQVLAKRRVPAP
jgi:hypothetical protein